MFWVGLTFAHVRDSTRIPSWYITFESVSKSEYCTCFTMILQWWNWVKNIKIKKIKKKKNVWVKNKIFRSKKSHDQRTNTYKSSCPSQNWYPTRKHHHRKQKHMTTLHVLNSVHNISWKNMLSMKWDPNISPSSVPIKVNK